MRIPEVARQMPDVAAAARALAPGLDWVGMDEIHAPVLVEGADGRVASLPARASAYVSLTRPEARGIHMSRLYLHVDRALSSEPLSPSMLRRVLRDFLDSHSELSDAALLHVE